MSTPAKKLVDVGIAIVFNAAHSHVLVCRRKHDTVLAGYYEFPGGKCDHGETPECCAIREVREEVALVVRALRELPAIEHEYPYAHVRLHPFVCEHVSGDLQLLAVADAQWVEPQHVLSYQFPEANDALVHAVSRGFAALLTTN